MSKALHRIAEKESFIKLIALFVTVFVCIKQNCIHYKKNKSELSLYNDEQIESFRISEKLVPQIPHF